MQTLDFAAGDSAPSQQSEDWRARIEMRLDDVLPAESEAPADLHRAMRYAVLGTAKRMRPQLCYATGEALGIEPALLDDAACALELVHGFSLIHDDLPAMDDDALRRGRPTTHKAFGVATAILAGDALQTLAFGLLAHSRSGSPDSRLAMLQLLADATGSLGMTGGQAMDLAAEGRRLELDALRELHRRKTGCLIRAAVLMACCADPSPDPALRERLDRFATDIGLAFQIRDDVLDIEGDVATLGKTQGKDVAQEKSTYPALLGMDGAKRQAEQLYQQALQALEPLGERARPLRWLAGRIVQRES
ncbi:MAG TPA: farnesyl diphosphate synthase [Rhodanobacteraceae bacterium]|nr:farnesyl diphosphate synthase [Rhodanobacteraceae bacterium]